MRSMTARLALCVILGVGAPLANAQWTLDGAASSVNFISLKNNAVGEVHSFTTVTGQIGEAGDARVVIDLDSVETLIPIRNERMREMLFNTEKFPEARISASINPALLNSVNPGSVLQLDLPLQVSLHGLEATITAPLVIVGESGGRMRVISARPLLVNAGSFGLLPGIEALQTVAGLNAISPVVPVTLQLLYLPATP